MNRRHGNSNYLAERFIAGAIKRTSYPEAAYRLGRGV